MGEERFFFLEVACPAKGCDNKDLYSWVHSTDEGRVKFSNRARIQCSKCSVTDHIKYWEFDCRKHKGGYQPACSSSYSKAISIAMEAGKMNRGLALEFVTFLINNPW